MNNQLAKFQELFPLLRRFHIIAQERNEKDGSRSYWFDAQFFLNIHGVHTNLKQSKVLIRSNAVPVEGNMQIF
jgi:hypothetical protein